MLVVDVGNSEITLGYFAGQELTHQWRLQTRHGITADELGVTIHGLLQAAGVDINNFARVMITSVVPQLNQPLAELFRQKKITLVDHQLRYSFRIGLENPAQIGADRLVNAEAVIRLYGAPAIFVDAGTATTFTVINSDAVYMGGAVAPGLQTAATALISRAARLAHLGHVELIAPASYIGHDTETGWRSGTVLGHAAMINGMVTAIQKELGGKAATTVGSGGLLTRMRKHLSTIQHFEPHLTLKGLMLLAENN